MEEEKELVQLLKGEISYHNIFFFNFTRIPIKSLGDKKYKFPEHSEDFFLIEGGLIPGSTSNLIKKP